MKQTIYEVNINFEWFLINLLSIKKQGVTNKNTLWFHKYKDVFHFDFANNKLWIFLHRAGFREYDIRIHSAF